MQTKRVVATVMELKNPDIEYVSLVDRGANQVPFVVWKREGGKPGNFRDEEGSDMKVLLEVFGPKKEVVEKALGLELPGEGEAAGAMRGWTLVEKADREGEAEVVRLGEGVIGLVGGVKDEARHGVMKRLFSPKRVLYEVREGEDGELEKVDVGAEVEKVLRELVEKAQAAAEEPVQKAEDGESQQISGMLEVYQVGAATFRAWMDMDPGAVMAKVVEMLSTAKVEKAEAGEGGDETVAKQEGGQEGQADEQGDVAEVGKADSSVADAGGADGGGDDDGAASPEGEEDEVAKGEEGDEGMKQELAQLTEMVKGLVEKVEGLEKGLEEKVSALTEKVEKVEQGVPVVKREEGDDGEPVVKKEDGGVFRGAIFGGAL